MYNIMAKDIAWAEIWIKWYYDNRCEDVSILKKGERVYLLWWTAGLKNFNIKSKWLSDKLDVVKYGSFKIAKKLKNDNY